MDCQEKQRIFIPQFLVSAWGHVKKVIPAPARGSWLERIMGIFNFFTPIMNAVIFSSEKYDHVRLEQTKINFAPIWQSPMNLKLIPINGYEISYLDQGKGFPVIFVHGSLSDYRSWGDQTDYFSRKYRTIVFGKFAKTIQLLSTPL